MLLSRKNKRFAFFLPMVVWLLVFLLYPTLDLIRLSFKDIGFVTEGTSGYTFENYTQLFQHSDFYTILRVTIIFVFFSVLFQMFLGFVLARVMVAGEDRGLVGTVVVRTSVLIGWVIPGVVVGIIWNLFLTESTTGILNYWLNAWGIGRLPFLSDPTWALISVTVANIWRGTAASMIMQYAGLKVLPNELHEAAVIDGASFIQETLYVTIPAMKPVLYTNLVLITIKTVNTFDSIIALTGGGPGRSTEVLALSAYLRVFRQFDLGSGAAIAVILFVINLVMTLIYSRIIDFEEEKGRAA
jgi:multiple sugar transport system permease protein